MANYTDQTKLNIVHGEVFINKWAGLSGSNNPVEIQDRINYFCGIATEYVNGRLRLGRYTVPFTAVPKTIEFITTLLAGVLLYDGRRERGTTEKGDEVVHKRKEFNRILRQILNGQLLLEHPTTGEYLAMNHFTAPTVVETDGCLCSQTCHDSQCWCTNCINMRSLLPYDCCCN